MASTVLASNWSRFKQLAGEGQGTSSGPWRAPHPRPRGLAPGTGAVEVPVLPTMNAGGGARWDPIDASLIHQWVCSSSLVVEFLWTPTGLPEIHSSIVQAIRGTSA